MANATSTARCNVQVSDKRGIMGGSMGDEGKGIR